MTATSATNSADSWNRYRRRSLDVTHARALCARLGLPDDWIQDRFDAYLDTDNIIHFTDHCTGGYINTLHPTVIEFTGEQHNELCPHCESPAELHALSGMRWMLNEVADTANARDDADDIRAADHRNVAVRLRDAHAVAHAHAADMAHMPQFATLRDTLHDAMMQAFQAGDQAAAATPADVAAAKHAITLVRWATVDGGVATPSEQVCIHLADMTDDRLPDRCDRASLDDTVRKAVASVRNHHRATEPGTSGPRDGRLRPYKLHAHTAALQASPNVIAITDIEQVDYQIADVYPARQISHRHQEREIAVVPRTVAEAFAAINPPGTIAISTLGIDGDGRGTLDMAMKLFATIGHTFAGTLVDLADTAIALTPAKTFETAPERAAA